MLAHRIDRFIPRPANFSSTVLLPIIAGLLVLSVYSWYMSYPLHILSQRLPFISAVYALYWISYPLLAVMLCRLSLVSRLAKWTASVGFFTLLHSLDYFYYVTPGSDPFFRDMIPVYFKAGFMDAQVSRYYQWPGFFILVRTFLLVTGMSQTSFDFLYHLTLGVLISSSVFILAERRRIDSFLAVIAYAITGYYFLNYQFVPQTLGLALVMVLIQREYAPATARNSVVATLLVTAVALVHAFVGLFYLVYLGLMGFRNAAYFRKALLVGTILVATNVFLTAIASGPLIGQVVKSLALLVGLSEYTLRASLTFQPMSPFQTMSRLSVLSAGILSAVGLVGLLKDRQVTARDAALTASVLLWMAMGVALPIIGVRGIQFAAIIAALGAGYLYKMITRRRLLAIVLMLLVVSSVFAVAHSNYEPFLYQPLPDTQAARFLSSSINFAVERQPIQIFSPFTERGVFPGFGFGNQVAEIWTDESYVITGDSPTSLDFALVTAVSQRYLLVRGQFFPQAVNDLTSNGNLVFHYGDGMVYAST